MDAPKLNEECCFSCLQPFVSTRSEINISENLESLKRILEINILLDKSNKSMNLCIPCYARFREAKEVYLKLRDLEKLFDSKRSTFAFTIVKSVVDDDYLGTSIENNFCNVRAKVYAKWQKEYKAHVTENGTSSVNDTEDASFGIKKEESVPVATYTKAAAKPPVKVIPVAISQSLAAPIVKNVVSLQNAQIIRRESTPFKQGHPQPGNSNPGTVNVAGQKNKKIIFVKRDPTTGKVYQVRPNNPDLSKPVTYRVANQTTGQPQTIRVSNIQGKPHMFQINKDGTVVKRPSAPPPPLPQARPIVRTPIPTASRIVQVAKSPPKANLPIAIARKSFPGVTAPAPIKRNVAEAESKSDEEIPSDNNVIEKKKRKISESQPQPAPVASPNQLSNRSRRVIRKPVDSSCLYGNEYEKAVKNSSKKPHFRTPRTVAVKRNSDSAVEMNEDSYRYNDMGEDQEEMEEEGGTYVDQFDEDLNNVDEPLEDDVEN